MIDFLYDSSLYLYFSSPIVAIVISLIFFFHPKHKKKLTGLILIGSLICSVIISSNVDKIGSDPLGLAFFVIIFNISAWFLASLGIIYTAYHIYLHTWRNHIVTVFFLILVTVLYAPNKTIRNYWNRLEHAEYLFWDKVITDNITTLPLSEYKSKTTRGVTHRRIYTRIDRANEKQHSKELLAILHELGISVLHVSYVDHSIINEYINKCKTYKNPAFCDLSRITKNNNLSDEVFEFVLLNVTRPHDIYNMIHSARGNTERLKKIQASLSSKSKLDKSTLGSQNRLIQGYINEGIEP